MYGAGLKFALYYTLLYYLIKGSQYYQVSLEAKKVQSESPKTKHVTNYYMSFTRVNVFVMSTTVNIASTFKPAL